ncbi:MAG: 4-hydroxy-tetrahydrodipicolinate reductase [Bacteroidales bacterium]|nr:4-hydroxy-tetrahydrodipicolinate reductase [Bacteroidales bacterium]
MNVALIGYGKMGKLIHQLAPDYHINVTLIIDIANKNDINNLKEKNIDVAIEFTTPNTAVDNIIACFQQNVPIVCGTTGWYDKIDFIKQECKKYNGALFYGPNFSIGVYLFKQIIEKSICIMNKLSEKYSITLTETHHEQKIDYPSGTALFIANLITANSNKYKKHYSILNKGFDENYNKFNDSITIASYRKNNFVGVHEVKFSSLNDTITLKHIALNRKIFAEGAILAAHYIKDKKGIKTIEDLISSL